MKLEHADYVMFWQTVADYLDAGQPLVRTLDVVGKKCSAGWREVIPGLIDVIMNGLTFSDAMARYDEVFTADMCAMIRAGEAGGVMDVVTQRLADGLRTGTFAIPGGSTDPAQDEVRFWRVFAILLSSGVPVLQVLGLSADTVSSTELRAAAEVIRRAILAGKGLASTLETLPDVFPEEVCHAVRRGERDGTLDTELFRVADCLEAGDLTPLVADGADEKPDVEASGLDGLDQVLAMLDEPGGIEALEKQSVQRAADAIKKVINAILYQAIVDRASDIHFDPFENRFTIRYRIDGVLYEFKPLPKEASVRVVNRLKQMSAMDIAEKRLPQDGRIMLRINGVPYDLRLSTAATVFGERAVISLLRPQQGLLELGDLGLCQRDMESVRELCQSRAGLVIATGPTGCGKTTLLYAMLKSINAPSRAILTVEDPVEYAIDGLAQIPIRPAIGLTYARALRAVLRQAPNVIMVGEIRDSEVALMVHQAALTGHLMFSTMHTNTASGVLRRLLDMGILPFMLNSALQGVIATRLVRLLCPECKQPAEPPLHSLPPEASDFIAALEKPTFFAPNGCEQCRQTGFHGRTALFEILCMNDAIRQQLAAGRGLPEVAAAAHEAGMRTLLEDGLAKAAQGLTSVEEVLWVATLQS